MLMSGLLQLSVSEREAEVSSFGWCLTPGVHLAAVGEDLVFLNVPADRYLCLPGESRRVMRAPRSNAVTVAHPDVAAELAGAGLIEQATPIARLGEPWAGHPTSSALPTRGELPRVRDLGEATVSLLDLFLRYRGRSFGELVRLAQDGATATPDMLPSADLLDVVADFHRWCPYAPISGKCLLRSFVLLRLLQRRGYGVRWVFGVSTWPFKAHCWLQCGATVLDDTFEHLWPYQPILVV